MPLGVLLKNETNHDDMISILQHLHHYVPTLSLTAESDIEDEKVHSILLGGDQLSTAMVRRVKAHRKNATSISDGLE